MLQSPVASSSSSSSSQGQASQSQSRHRLSASLGKTHFKLAPGLLQTAPPHTRYYDDQWQTWMSSSASSHPTASVQSSSYDSAWQRWMVKHTPSTSAPTAVLFEEVPRAAMLPIMSRLPLQAGEPNDKIAEEPTRAGNLDYLTSSDNAGGVHPADEVASTALLKYSRARLPVLDDESYHLWKSLHSLRSLSDEYDEGYEVVSRKAQKNTLAAPHPISQGMDEAQCPVFANSTSLSAQNALVLVKKLFNWDELPELPEDVEYTWYGVVFRSKRREGSESVNLYEDDRRSHEEAVNSGGLLMYWYGKPSAKTGHNLATCIWTSRQEAIQASSLPLHARAAVHARKAYESFELSRYAIRKVQGETRLRLEEWVE